MINCKDKGLRNRVLTAVCLLLAASSFAAYNHIRTLIDEPVEDLQRSAFDIAEHIRRELSIERGNVERVSEYLGNGGTLVGLSDLARVSFLPRNVNLIVFNDDGQQIFDAAFPLHVGGSTGNPCVSAAMRDQVTAVCDLYKGNHSDEWRVSIIAPLWRNMTVTGAVTATWTPESLRSVVNQVSLYPGARWSLVDRTGRIIVLPSNPSFVGKMLPPDLGKGITTEGEPAWRKSFTVDERIVRVWATVPSVDWTVSVIMPQEAIMYRVYWWAIAYGAILSCVLAMVLGLTRLDQAIPIWVGPHLVWIRKSLPIAAIANRLLKTIR